MQTLNVDLAGRGYPIFIGSNILSEGAIYAKFIRSKQVLILTNETIAPLYLEKLKSQLSNYEVHSCILPDGEQYKNLAHLNQIYDSLLGARFGRNATLLALGGGVIGDMGGFAAATYQRGIPFVQIPTTLLAQVDSSVGGKTGVNHALGKNMIGAFYQPQCVVIDTDVLSTLDDRQLSAGLAEVIKYGLIRDKAFFEWLEHNIPALLNRDPQALAYAIETSCRNKAQVVAEDEFETGVRATLNLGHTFGHAIETASGYGHYLHGEAVAIGCCQAADLSQRLGYINQADKRRVESLIAAANLPIHPPTSMQAADFLKYMAVDKKNVDGAIRLILLKSVGEALLPLSVNREILLATLDNYGRK